MSGTCSSKPRRSSNSLIFTRSRAGESLISNKLLANSFSFRFKISKRAANQSDVRMLVSLAAAVSSNSSCEKTGAFRNSRYLLTPSWPNGSQSEGAKLTASLKLNCRKSANQTPITERRIAYTVIKACMICLRECHDKLSCPLIQRINSHSSLHQLFRS